MKRAKVEWPCIHAGLEDLPGAIVKSMIPVLHADGQVDELLVKNVFKVQQELIYIDCFRRLAYYLKRLSLARTLFPHELLSTTNMIQNGSKFTVSRHTDKRTHYCTMRASEHVPYSPV